MNPAFINRIPSGLLGFLGIKNGGENPQQLSNILVPMLDLIPLYDLQGVEYSQAVSTLGAGVTTFGIPGSNNRPSSFFHTLNFGVAVNCGAGANCYYQIGVYRASQAFFVPLGPIVYADNAVASTIWTGSAAVDVWTGPDEQLAINCYSVSGAPALRTWSRAVEYRA